MNVCQPSSSDKLQYHTAFCMLYFACSCVSAYVFLSERRRLGFYSWTPRSSCATPSPVSRETGDCRGGALDDRAAAGERAALHAGCCMIVHSALSRAHVSRGCPARSPDSQSHFNLDPRFQIGPHLPSATRRSTAYNRYYILYTWWL